MGEPTLVGKSCYTSLVQPFVGTKIADTILAKEPRALEKLQSLTAGGQASENAYTVSSF